MFIEQKKDIDRSSTLYSIKAPFELFHADIAIIKLLSKSAFDPHYCLLCIDLSSSKIYTYSMIKSLLVKKKWSTFMKKLKRKKEIVVNK